MNSNSASWNVHIIGAGVVGRAIAAEHLRHGIAVNLIDQSREQLTSATEEICGDVDLSSYRPTTWTDDTWTIQLTNSSCVSIDASQAQAIVIESIIEKREPKRAVLAQAEQRFVSDAILATNTSTIPIAEITNEIVNPGRCCGLHFFMPVDQRPLIEVITTNATSRRTIDVACRYAAAIGKQSLVVRDRPGFVVNRMLVSYLGEAVHLICSGASAAKIERAALTLGMPMSPMELMDWIGMETNFHAGRAIWQAYPSRIEPSPLTPAMVKAGLKGRAGGEGFYEYESGNRSENLAPVALGLIADYMRDQREWTNDEISHRLSFPMLIEAAYILIENVVPGLASIELAMRGGLGLSKPGGFVGYFDTIGPSRCIEILDNLRGVGRRYEAPRALHIALSEEPTVAQALERLSVPE